MSASACPDAEQLAAFLDRMLPAGERDLVERHLAGCKACRALVAASARSMEHDGERRAARDRRMPIGLGIALLLAALLLVLLRAC